MEPNPDELEIAKLRTKLSEAKLFKDYLVRENKFLKERIEKNDIRLKEDEKNQGTEDRSNQSLLCSLLKRKKND